MVARGSDRACDGQGTRAGKLSGHPDLLDCLYLVRNGVPFDVAFSLPDEERAAFVVAIGRLDGGVFDTQAMRWRMPGRQSDGDVRWTRPRT